MNRRHFFGSLIAVPLVAAGLQADPPHRKPRGARRPFHVPSRKFPTIRSTYPYLKTGDYVAIHEGTHNETLVLYSGVTFDFYPGSVLQYDGDEDKPLIYDTIRTMGCVITGQGIFRRNATARAPNAHSVALYHGSSLIMQCERIEQVTPFAEAVYNRAGHLSFTGSISSQSMCVRTDYGSWKTSLYGGIYAAWRDYGILSGGGMVEMSGVDVTSLGNSAVHVSNGSASIFGSQFLSTHGAALEHSGGYVRVHDSILSCSDDRQCYNEGVMKYGGSQMVLDNCDINVASDKGWSIGTLCNEYPQKVEIKGDCRGNRPLSPWIRTKGGRFIVVGD